DLEAEDKNGHTAMAEAMLRGDQQAMERLQKAGAKQPKPAERSNFIASMTELASSVRHSTPMINVPDVGQTIDWYKSIGFKEIGRNEDDGIVNWGALSFGKADLMLNMNGKAGLHDVTLWFYTDQVDKLYELLKSKQLEVAQAALEEKSPSS